MLRDHKEDFAFAQPLPIKAARNRPEKRDYVIAKDLKTAGLLVPQLQEAGYVKWAAGFADAADVMQWQDPLLDLESEYYDFEHEEPAGEINRMVAWLLLIGTTKGYEDLIEEEVQSGDKKFLAAYKNIYFDFNSDHIQPQCIVRRAIPSHYGRHTAQRSFLCYLSRQKIVQD